MTEVAEKKRAPEPKAPTEQARCPKCKVETYVVTLPAEGGKGPGDRVLLEKRPIGIVNVPPGNQPAATVIHASGAAFYGRLANEADLRKEQDGLVRVIRGYEPHALYCEGTEDPRLKPQPHEIEKKETEADGGSEQTSGG